MKNAKKIYFSKSAIYQEQNQHNKVPQSYAFNCECG